MIPTREELIFPVDSALSDIDNNTTQYLNILQWNCDHFPAKLQFLLDNIRNRNIHIIPLSEGDKFYHEFTPSGKIDKVTHCKLPNINGFNCYNDFHGKSAIYIKQTITHEHININYTINNEDASYTLYRTWIKLIPPNKHLKPTFIASVYRPPNKHNDILDLFTDISTIKQLHGTSIYWLIGGDLNCKHLIVGSHITNAKTIPAKQGYRLIKKLDELSAIILNNGEHTHHHKYHKNFNVLDWTIHSSHMDTTSSDWRTTHDKLNSDHYIILFQIQHKSVINTIHPIWKLNIHISPNWD